MTRVGFEYRVADFLQETTKQANEAIEQQIEDAVRHFVDYLLFIDEAPLSDRIAGTSGYREKFTALGPRDGEGRSLREFDLEKRMMRYPCSYMIYTDAFDGMPERAKTAIYERMWTILSGQEKDARYARLSAADRQAIVEILRDTKKGLPLQYAR
jgi:hypothetical protein